MFYKTSHRRHLGQANRHVLSFLGGSRGEVEVNRKIMSCLRCPKLRRGFWKCPENRAFLQRMLKSRRLLWNSISLLFIAFYLGRLQESLTLLSSPFLPGVAPQKIPRDCLGIVVRIFIKRSHNILYANRVGSPAYIC